MEKAVNRADAQNEGVFFGIVPDEKRVILSYNAFNKEKALSWLNSRSTGADG